MNQKGLILTFFLFISIYVFAQDLKSDCLKFRTGIFQYVNDSSELVTVERSKKYQVERNQKTGDVDKFKIKWVSDCIYEIQPFWSSNKIKRRKRGGPTQVQMLNVKEDRYDYTCTCKTIEKGESFKGIMRRVK